MKQGHLALIFITIYVACFSILKVEQYQYDKVQYEKKTIEKALVDAMDVAVKDYANLVNESEKEKQKGFGQGFLEALYISMGGIENPEMQERLRIHLPLMIIVEEDGVYFGYMEDVKLQQVWTEKKVFPCLSEYDEYQKRDYIADFLENQASEYITNHNFIASQYGILYSFFVPNFFKDNVDTIQFPMLFVVFQGWPLNAAGNVFYENCLDVGSYLEKSEYFILEFPMDLAETKSRYHRGGCSELEKKEKKISEVFWKKEEAIRKYGALPCEKCVFQIR